MKYTKQTLLALVAATAFTTTIGHAAFAQELSIMASGGAWQDAQRKAWFEPFSKETGVKILEQEYLGDLGKVKAMVDTGNVPIDLVTVETATVLQL
ncbi:MAG: ABC transporter substrate-binding protein, partial [Mesorhizobium sp.]